MPESAANQFVHLHVHSEYSISDGIVRLQQLAAAAAENQFPAVALTDFANVYGMVKFYRACVGAGVKPLLGSDVWVQNPCKPGEAARMILLCRDHRGYQNLSKLLTSTYQQHDRGKVIVRWDELVQWRDGLLALLDDQEGALADPPNPQYAQQVLQIHQATFADALYFQVSRVGRAGENAYIHQVAELGAKHGVGLVATNRVEFLGAEEFDAHEIRVCIQEGRSLDDSRRQRKFSEQQYLKTSQQMAELFADLPEAIHNSVEIAKRCNLFLNFEQNFLPDYPEAGDQPPPKILRQNAEQGLCQRLGIADLRDGDPERGVGASSIAAKKYAERLDFELGVIDKMGFASYFLIVADFISWSWQNDIPVGPGRGSGAGSLVAWATGITEIDPLRYGLLFERFLNPERVSLPDFDIDFCVDGRDRVIEYVSARYGSEKVSQITTFGTMAARAALRDVGRVMGMPYGMMDQLAKLVPFEPGMTLEKALKQENLLMERYNEGGEVRELFDNAMKLEGIARNVGTHAGGVVIAPQALTEYTPLYRDSRTQQITTQLDKDDLEAIGLVKFDFLGLRTLTIIAHAVKIINAQRDPDAPLRMEDLALDDPATYQLLRDGRTQAIFQIESHGIRELIARLRPNQFDDIVALVALYRPGPLQSGMVDDFIKRKHGEARISYPHELLEPILKSTYGVIVYQEQVMQIAQVLAGYSLGDSDLLRSAMGKKKPETMDAQREIFRNGAIANGIKAETATRIFELMEKFAGYGFNKSHSVAYALVAYHTAWLKAHHPAAFMAATLTAEGGDSDKIAELLVDCKALNLKILPPDINRGTLEFQALDDKTILYGLGAVKGIGKNFIETIVQFRQQQPYQDMPDFCRRFSRKDVHRNTLEVLIKCGAMDTFNSNRAALYAEMDDALRAAEQYRTVQTTGQADVFGEVEIPAHPTTSKAVATWSTQQLLRAEKEALGVYLSGHPYHLYRELLAPVNCEDLSKAQTGLFSGLVASIRALKTRRGKMAFVMLDNDENRVEVILGAEKYQQYRALLKKDMVLVAHGEISIDEYTGGNQLRADRLFDIGEFFELCLRSIHIQLREQDNIPLQAIQKALTGARKPDASTAIVFHYEREQGECGAIKLGNQWRIRPSVGAIRGLRKLFGKHNLRYKYDTSGLSVTQRWRRGEKTEPPPLR